MLQYPMRLFLPTFQGSKHTQNQVTGSRLHYIARTAADTVVDAAAALLNNNVEASHMPDSHRKKDSSEG